MSDVSKEQNPFIHSSIKFLCVLIVSWGVLYNFQVSWKAFLVFVCNRYDDKFGAWGTFSLYQVGLVIISLFEAVPILLFALANFGKLSRFSYAQVVFLSLASAYFSLLLIFGLMGNFVAAALISMVFYAIALQKCSQNRLVKIALKNAAKINWYLLGFLAAFIISVRMAIPSSTLDLIRPHLTDGYQYIPMFLFL